NTALEHELRDGGSGLARGAEFELVATMKVLGGNRDARNAEQRALERGRNRPRVRHVITEVPPLVDARDDQVRLLLDDVRDGEVDAVGRRAVDAERLRRDG